MDEYPLGVEDCEDDLVIISADPQSGYITVFKLHEVFHLCPSRADLPGESCQRS